MKPLGKSLSATVFTSARKYRRRRRFAVATLILALLLAFGYVLLQVITSPPSVSTGEAASVKNAPNPPKEREAKKVKAPVKQLAKGPPLPAPAESCDDLRVLVDHEHPLPYGYVPRDLVSLGAAGVPVLNGDPLLRSEAAGQLQLLMAAAASDGEDLIVASSYRSYADQQASYDKWVAFYGDPNAGGMSALPGYSQHQLGTAVDFTNSAAEYQIWQPFGRTSGSAWLEKNARQYGYVLAYPKNLEAETGYQWEPWHYRYIGVRNAERLEESGMSLHEFLTEEGVLPRC